MAAGKTKRVELKLGINLCAFNATQQRLFLFAIAAFLDLPPEEMTVTSIEEDSVKIEVELPSKAAERLVDSFKSRDPFTLEILSHSYTVSAAIVSRVGQDHLDSSSSPSPGIGIGDNLDEFLKSAGTRVRALLVRYCIPEEDRADVIQQASFDLFDRWEVARDPEAWLLGTLKRKCLFYWRDQRRRMVYDAEAALLEFLRDGRL
jgi:sigma-70-like protein